MKTISKIYFRFIFFSQPLKFTEKEPCPVPVTRSEVGLEMADFTIEELDEAIDKLENEAREIRANLKLCACAIGFLVVFLILIMYFYFSGMHWHAP